MKIDKEMMVSIKQLPLRYDIYYSLYHDILFILYGVCVGPLDEYAAGSYISVWMYGLIKHCLIISGYNRLY